MIKKMEMANLNGTMETYIQVHGSTIKYMELEK